ncbi:putative reverse transcriptase domain-containing protein [Tanacetum coccineum]
MNGDDSYNSGMGVRRTEHVARECTYQDFMKSQPLFLKGTEGVVELTQWTVGYDVAYAMTWTSLKKKMTDKYCPRGEIKMLEVAHMIHGSVMASKPKTMQDAIEMATELMDKKIRTLAERQAKNKRKFDDTSKNNQNQQQQNKGHNTSRAYTAGLGDKKPYGRSKPVGHLARDCKSPTNANPANNQRDIRAGQKPTCYECGNQGHYRSDCPKLKNQNHENQTGGTGARGVVHALGGGETNQDY